MMTAGEGHRTSNRTARALLAPGVVAVGLAGWWIVEGRPERAGLVLLVAAACLILVAALARAGSPRDVLLISMADRLFDGIALGAIAWAYRSAEPATAAGAIVALGASFLSAYIRIRGASLGYDVQEALATRVICYGLISIGLVAGLIDRTVWALAAFVLLCAAVRASQVAKEERA
jgi:hypothetical protein